MKNENMKEILRKLSVEDIMKGYYELEEYNKTGQLAGICREYFELFFPDFREEHISPHVMLYIWNQEMADRFAKIYPMIQK
jgi:hypothetical protein